MTKWTPSVIALIGQAGSGKTTAAKQLESNHNYVRVRSLCWAKLVNFQPNRVISNYTTVKSLKAAINDIIAHSEKGANDDPQES